MERTFPPKTIVLVPNTQGTIQWGAPDFSPRFNESIIKKNVSIRFTCSNSAGNAVYCGVRYDTLTKTYQVAERKSLFLIPPNSSVEVTPASKPALGFLNEYITNIYLDCITPVASTVTASIIIDDDPPGLSADPGALLGLDNKLVSDYVSVHTFGGVVVPALGSVNIFNYLVPPGRRFFLDVITISMPPTPSYPGLLQLQTILAGNFSLFVNSRTDAFVDMVPFQTLSYPFAEGDQINITAFNTDTAAYTVNCSILGREVY